MKDLKELIKEYPTCTALIRYAVNGRIFDWSIGARPGPKGDNEQTLRKHLARHKPDAEFLSCEIK
jgi:hypothetical protein